MQNKLIQSIKKVIEHASQISNREILRDCEELFNKIDCMEVELVYYEGHLAQQDYYEKMPFIKCLESILENEPETTKGFIASLNYDLVECSEDFEELIAPEVDELKSIEDFDKLMTRVKEIIEDHHNSKPKI